MKTKTLSKRLWGILCLILLCPLSLMAETTLAAWSFGQGYDESENDKIYTYTPNSNTFGENSGDYVKNKKPVFLPNTWLAGTAQSSYQLTCQTNHKWSLTDRKRYLFRINTSNSATNRCTDFTDGSKHQFYFEASLPTTGYKSIRLNYAIGDGSSLGMPFEIVASTDGGNTWTDYGSRKCHSHWGTYTDQNVSLLVANQPQVIIRIILAGEKDSNFNLKYLNIYGTEGTEDPTYYPFTFTTNGASAAYTSITAEPAGMEIAGKTYYAEGTRVTMNAATYKNVTFMKWEDGSTNPSRLITVNSEMNTQAYFSTNKDYIAGWDFYSPGSSNYKAPFTNSENEGKAVFQLINGSNGSSLNWKDNSANGYNNAKCVRMNKEYTENDYYRATISTTGCTNIKVTTTIGAGGWGSYDKYNLEYSLNGTDYTVIDGSEVTLTLNSWQTQEVMLPSACENQETLYIRIGHPTDAGKLDANNESDEFAIQDFYVEQVTSALTVTTNSAGWASFSAPQNVTLSAGAQAYTCSAVDEKAVTLTEITNVPAGQGVFIKGDPSTEYTATVVSEADAVGTNYIKGCLNDVQLNGTEGAYIIGVKSGNAGLYYVNSAVTIPAGKAYLQPANGSQAKSLRIAFSNDDTTTGICVTEDSSVISKPCKIIINGRLLVKTDNGIYSISGIHEK